MDLPTVRVGTQMVIMRKANNNGALSIIQQEENIDEEDDRDKGARRVIMEAVCSKSLN